MAINRGLPGTVTHVKRPASSKTRFEIGHYSYRHPEVVHLHTREDVDVHKFNVRCI